MDSAPIGPDAVRLLSRLRSWEELEVLLAVALPEDDDTTATVAQALARPEDAIAAAVARLEEAGLVRRATATRVAPTEDARSAVQALATAYAQDPAGVLRMASALAMERARTSASVLMTLEVLGGAGRS